MHPKHDLPRPFADLGLEVRFLKALTKVGFRDPSEIQRVLIPLILEGKDVLGQARTGTGKTAAFALPVLQQMDPGQSLQALCLVPTRELAVQVMGEVQRMAAFTELHCLAVYGGEKISTQLHQLGRKPHFVVGTPGRVMDMMQRRALDIAQIRFVILDEVDRMLDIGFRDDIRHILSHVKARHQTILCSATVDEEIRRLSQKYMNEPVEVNVSRDDITVSEVEQAYFSVEQYDKFRLLRMLLDEEKPPLILIFTNTKHGARKLAKKLYDGGISAQEIHGDLEQRQRNRVMDSFRKHKLRVLVATDLASRGIDVSAISHIINYDVPVDTQVYVHRIGRTARMGAKGKAFTFVTREQGKQLTEIEKLINKELPMRTLANFVPSSESDRHAFPPPTLMPSRVESVATSARPSPVQSQTLGGKFRPRRRRRL